ncbi:ras-like protein 2 [Podospora australis]|uniref:Ras-like protein 2 n=1 Tax=Podospora australis TaxID=1536484 RepID=A0AAN6X6I5_9PEZI|nr:ras-like protein 2 [Podospora australis]
MRSPHTHNPSGSLSGPGHLSSPPSAAPSTTVPVPISITICGDGGCGKSSITLRLVRSQWTEEYDPTIEDSYSITRRIDGVTYHLSLTDTAGQEEYRGMWASSNLGADAFLLVYDITSLDSLHALQYFDDLIDMEAETRLDNAARARKAGLALSPTLPDGLYHAGGGAGSGAKMIPPIKIVAGNKCDLQESRQVPAAVGLEWARQRGCGFMETSARNEVNIEETFALIVRRVVEARKLAEMGDTARAGLGAEDMMGNKRGMTKPLTPLPSGRDAEDEDEKGDHHHRGPGVRGPSIGGAGRGSGFWKKLRCW